MEEERHFRGQEDGTVWWEGQLGDAEEVVVEGLACGGEEGGWGGRWGHCRWWGLGSAGAGWGSFLGSQGR